MTCGHCSADYHPDTKMLYLGGDASAQLWKVHYEQCPRCHKLNIRLVSLLPNPQAPQQMAHQKSSRTVYPKEGTSRKAARAVVPRPLQEDYNEACLVFGRQRESQRRTQVRGQLVRSDGFANLLVEILRLHLCLVAKNVL